MADDLLRTLVDLREQLQKTRIQFGNRAAALRRGRDLGEDAQLEAILRWEKAFRVLEEDANSEIAALVRESPVYPYLSQVRGVGPTLAAKLLAFVDFSRSPTVSALWRYAGFAVIDGRAERPRRGERLHYNRRLKTAVYLVATSFLRVGSPYRRIYEAARAYYEASRPGWTRAHIHLAALRKMAKVFLQHLWAYGRTLHGLPVTKPYVHEQLGHTTYHAPEEFGWPPLGDRAAG